MTALDWIKNDILLFDGGMGTMLQQRGLSLGELPELLNLSRPDVVTGIHREYTLAGADVITTNTFQAHELKLRDERSVKRVIAAGVDCARRSGARFVALDIGPLGQLLEPAGGLSFERAYDIFARQMEAGAAAGADIILIETISDPYEAKAAILAARESTGLPVFCTMTFQEDGRSFVGCDALTATLILQGLGVDALGANCSLGPELLMPVVDTMLEYSRLPVMVQPNAGMPSAGEGDAGYELSPSEYADYVLGMAHKGVRILGGCCGTTPQHIRLIRRGLSGFRPAAVSQNRVTACTSGSRTVIFDNGVVEIGECLNPTGKKPMQQALREGSMDWLLGEAAVQVRAGAQVLDLNVGMPGLDEPMLMAKSVRAIQAITDVPLQIDSADPAAIEAGLRVYNGRAIINSVNGKAQSLERVLPLAKKYGALVIGLTLDEKGIPPDAKGRLDIARRIRDRANELGIPNEDLIIDCLTLTASAQQEQVSQTLKAIGMVKEQLGLKSVLGVSNVSFGLPNRDIINSTFLGAALGAGLDAAILNPISPRYREVMDTWRVLSGEDKSASRYLRRYAGESRLPPNPQDGRVELADLIRQGRRDEAVKMVKAKLRTEAPLDIIDRDFVPALGSVGRSFERGEIFLPQLMMSAQAVQGGFRVIKEHMLSGGVQRSVKGKILLATVHGDIHDIGKNIVALLLESYGYDVLDLGKDVPAHAVVEAAANSQIKLIGLSALMTTTVKCMKETIAAVRAAGLDCAFMVGGAVLSPEYADMVGADFYARDAMEGVAVADRFFK